LKRRIFLPPSLEMEHKTKQKHGIQIKCCCVLRLFCKTNWALYLRSKTFIRFSTSKANYQQTFTYKCTNSKVHTCHAKLHYIPLKPWWHGAKIIEILWRKRPGFESYSGDTFNNDTWRS
jgi:hypothetical protein